ncbi:oxidoreductase [Granulicella mallensis]|uniref:NAD(P)-dependent dehydrogenase (Short-subunit alcohol dehydrogenase family) n=1 Tax=Granulicella mallensis TaxID=940614 RepID=A0A7W7ZTI8_9BACT|nr:oxidoreductase [Granulicella mallensis]MBB5065826.1 NAD(P)-dependent dehydrogenase (short-subunit alcohol dehydrogenase family) [Granulicella mallensis]
MANKTILITGVSSGLGLALAQEALAQGWTVVGTVRSEEAARNFTATAPGKSFAYVLDVTDYARIPEVVAEIEKTIGGIEVLVNNAGYGMEGPIEESSLEEIRRQFEVNVFGALAVTQAVLPFMRQRRSGRILNITSMGGLITFPGVGIYHGSKFALEGLSETLGKEVRGFGIFVTAVAPGGFRTDWAGRSLSRAPRTIPDYDEMFEPQREARQQRNGKQSGDPVKAAKAMLTILADPNPPAHLLLGPDAVKLVEEKLDALKAEIEAYRSLSISTDFDAI